MQDVLKFGTFKGLQVVTAVSHSTFLQIVNFEVFWFTWDLSMQIFVFMSKSLVYYTYCKSLRICERIQFEESVKIQFNI